jgi:hypothetical protein
LFHADEKVKQKTAKLRIPAKHFAKKNNKSQSYHQKNLRSRFIVTLHTKPKRALAAA